MQLPNKLHSIYLSYGIPFAANYIGRNLINPLNPSPLKNSISNIIKLLNPYLDLKTNKILLSFLINFSSSISFF